VLTGWVTERFRTLAARAGLPPVTFHGLRHGSASMLLAAGVDLKVVSQIMGHATAAFTADVYVNRAGGDGRLGSRCDRRVRAPQEQDRSRTCQQCAGRRRR